MARCRLGLAATHPNERMTFPMKCHCIIREILTIMGAGGRGRLLLGGNHSQSHYRPANSHGSYGPLDLPLLKQYGKQSYSGLTVAFL